MKCDCSRTMRVHQQRADTLAPRAPARQAGRASGRRARHRVLRASRAGRPAHRPRTAGWTPQRALVHAAVRLPCP